MSGLTKVSNSLIENPRINPNLIVDGNFDHWFEGTSQTTSGYGSDTMWINTHGGSTKTHSRQSFAVGETEGWDAPATFFSRTAVTSVVGASNYCVKLQKIESVAKTASRKITLSFQAKANAAKNIAIEFVQNFGSGGSPSAEVTGIGAQLIALTTAWKKYIITAQMPSISGKTLGTANNDFLGVCFWLDAGADFNARTANLGQQSGTFDIAQVKLEFGDVATPFVAPDPQQELARVQRFLKMMNFGVYYGEAGTFSSYVSFGVTMRTAPTISVAYAGTSYGVTSESWNATDASGSRHSITLSAGGGAWDKVIKLDSRL